MCYCSSIIEPGNRGTGTTKHAVLHALVLIAEHFVLAFLGLGLHALCSEQHCIIHPDHCIDTTLCCCAGKPVLIMRLLWCGGTAANQSTSCKAWELLSPVWLARCCSNGPCYLANLNVNCSYKHIIFSQQAWLSQFAWADLQQCTVALATCEAFLGRMHNQCRFGPAQGLCLHAWQRHISWQDAHIIAVRCARVSGSHLAHQTAQKWSPLDCTMHSSHALLSYRV